MPSSWCNSTSFPIWPWLLIILSDRIPRVEESKCQNLWKTGYHTTDEVATDYVLAVVFLVVIWYFPWSVIIVKKGIHKPIHSSICIKYDFIYFSSITLYYNPLIFSKSTWHLNFSIRYHKHIKNKRDCPSKNFPQLSHTWFLLSDLLPLI